ncbi:MAG: DUF3313 family protein [Pseudomonadota bacterium]
MKVILLLLAATLLVACGGTARTIDTRPEVVPSFDGLLPVESGVFSAAWSDPNVDFARYDKVLPAAVDFEFRAEPSSGPDGAAQVSPDGEFWISEQDKQTLTSAVQDAIATELADSAAWQLADEPGQNTLVLTTTLLDIVAERPSDQLGASEVYLGFVGEAALVMELRDSLTGRTLYRAVDRGPADRAGRDTGRSNAATTWTEVRRWARRWAARLAEGLDSIRDAGAG